MPKNKNARKSKKYVSNVGKSTKQSNTTNSNNTSKITLADIVLLIQILEYIQDTTLYKLVLAFLGSLPQ